MGAGCAYQHVVLEGMRNRHSAPISIYIICGLLRFAVVGYKLFLIMSFRVTPMALGLCGEWPAAREAYRENTDEYILWIHQDLWYSEIVCSNSNDTDNLNSSSWKSRIYLSHTANIVAAVCWETQWSRTSAVMPLSYSFHNILGKRRVTFVISHEQHSRIFRLISLYFNLIYFIQFLVKSHDLNVFTNVRYRRFKIRIKR